MTALVISAVIINKPGPIINNQRSEAFGINSSLKNNFTPSAKGCNNPKGPARFGPSRSCKKAANFRSA